jgi:hypothetical protein
MEETGGKPPVKTCRVGIQDFAGGSSRGKGMSENKARTQTGPVRGVQLRMRSGRRSVPAALRHSALCVRPLLLGATTEAGRPAKGVPLAGRLDDETPVKICKRKSANLQLNFPSKAREANRRSRGSLNCRSFHATRWANSNGDARTDREKGGCLENVTHARARLRRRGSSGRSQLGRWHLLGRLFSTFKPMNIL